MSHLPQTTLVDLPPEVLQIIFSRLSIGDLGQIQRVNKRLHAVANEIRNPAGKRLACKNRIGINVYFGDRHVPEDEHQLKFNEIAIIHIYDLDETGYRPHPSMRIRATCCDRHPQPTEEQIRNVCQEWPSMKIEEAFKLSLEEIEARINEARENDPDDLFDYEPVSVEQAFWTRTEAFDYLKDLLFYTYYEYGYVDSLTLGSVTKEAWIEMRDFFDTHSYLIRNKTSISIEFYPTNISELFASPFFSKGVKSLSILYSNDVGIEPNYELFRHETVINAETLFVGPSGSDGLKCFGLDDAFLANMKYKRFHIEQVNMTNNCLEILLKHFYENRKRHVDNWYYSFGIVGPIDLEKSLKSLPESAIQTREDEFAIERMLTNRHDEKLIIKYDQFEDYFILIISGY